MSPLIRPALSLLEDRARLAQMAQDLADEERAAFGLVVEGAGERDAGLGQLVTGGGGDESDHRRLVEPVQREALHAGLAAEVGEHRGQRMRAREIGVAVGADDRAAGAASPSSGCA